MGIWAASEIKALRLRFGWSVANMARRLKVKTDELRQWELGELAPTRKQNAELEKLSLQLSKYSSLIKNSPQIEAHMENENKEQIVNSDVHFENKV